MFECSIIFLHDLFITFAISDFGSWSPALSIRLCLEYNLPSSKWSRSNSLGVHANITTLEIQLACICMHVLSLICMHFHSSARTCTHMPREKAGALVDASDGFDPRCAFSTDDNAKRGDA